MPPSQASFCWWPSNLCCLDICWQSDGQDQVPYVHGTCTSKSRWHVPNSMPWPGMYTPELARKTWAVLISAQRFLKSIAALGGLLNFMQDLNINDAERLMLLTFVMFRNAMISYNCMFDGNSITLCITINPSHRCGHPQADCREPAGSYDKTTRAAICFEHKTQYLLIRAPYTILWYFGTSVTYPQWFHRAKLIVIPPRFV